MARDGKLKQNKKRKMSQVVFENPYGILNSIDYPRFVETVGRSIPSYQQTKSSWFESKVSHGFWGTVGLKGFNWYPELMNFLDNRDIKSSSEIFLRYLYTRIKEGSSLKECLLLTYIFYSGVGFRMNDVEGWEWALYCVPKLLYRIATSFDLDKAQQKAADDYNEKQKKSIFHLTTSAICVLCYYFYYHESDISTIRDLSCVVIETYNNSENLEDLMTKLIPKVLGDSGENTLKGIYHSSYIIESYKRKIDDSKAKDVFDRFCVIPKQNIFESISKYEEYKQKK